MKIGRMVMVFAIAICFAVIVSAQDYPSKSVTVIVPCTEGSATDVIARIVSKKLSGMWGQPVTIENRPGAPDHP